MFSKDILNSITKWYICEQLHANIVNIRKSVICLGLLLKFV